MGLCGGEWLAVSDVRQEGLRMSEARLELVEPCEHGYVELPNDQSRHAQSTVLTAVLVALAGFCPYQP
jgi:hypothetical protein